MDQLHSLPDKNLPALGSVVLFFRFLGYLSHELKEVLLGRLSITWSNVVVTIYCSGAQLVIPMMVINALMGVSLVLNIYNLLSPYNLQHQVLLVAQRILFYDLIPFLISLVLSIQLALNLINEEWNMTDQSRQDIVIRYILPLMLGMAINALFLYVYSLNAVYISIYFCFQYLVKTDLHEYVFHLVNTLTTQDISYSLLKTLSYCFVISFIVGYYYYETAVGYLTLRKAMSRIMTRSFVFLVSSSIYLKFIE